MKYLFSIIMLLCANVLYGQDVTVTLSDSSSIRGNIVSDNTEIITKYGKLVIPWTDIQSIKYGIFYKEGLKEDITKNIKNLGSNVHKERALAQRFLMEQDKYAYPLLKDALNENKDLEIIARLKEITTSMETKNKMDEYSYYDEIITLDSNIIGSISSRVTKLKSPLFKEMELDSNNITEIKSNKIFKLNVAEYGMDNAKWFNTNVNITQNATITATGTIDLWVAQPKTHMTGPNGKDNVLGIGGLYNTGLLLGKIGNNGEEFIVGTQKTLENMRGILYLRIVPSQWLQNPPVGYYRIILK